MDVIRAIKNYSYYNRILGQSREEWMVWRVQAVKEWMLDEEILKEGMEESGGKADCECKGCNGCAACVRIKGLRDNQGSQSGAGGEGVHHNSREGSDSVL